MSNEKSHPEQERIFRLEISGGFLLLLSFTAFLCGGGNVFAAAIAAAFHELGHLAALSVCAVPVEGVRLGFFGAVIHAGPMSLGQEAFCALAGPAANLFAFWTLRRAWPGAAVASLALGLCNLLPIRPLDGGRALWAFSARILPLPAAMAISGAAEALTLCALGIGALILSRRFGPLPAALYALLLANLARERIFLLPSGTLADIMKKKKTTQEV